MRDIIYWFLCVIIIGSFFSCQTEKKEFFSIGVSLPNDDLWHQAVVNELKHEATFYPDIKLTIKYHKNTDDNQQIEDIRSFVNDKMDLIVVSTGNASLITPLIQQIYKSGVPVIAFDQNIATEDYTAYVGGDNYMIGHDVGAFIVDKLNGRGYVAEIRGRVESKTDIERHNGLMDFIRKFPEIQLIAEEKANFETNLAEKRMTEIIKSNKSIDIVFAMDDLTAKGVYNACRKAGIKQPFTIGVDALAGKGGGIENILNGCQDISFIYPTGGAKVLEVAHHILTGKSFDRQNILYTGIVDRSNAQLIKKQREEFFSEREKTSKISNTLNQALNEYSKQRIFFYVSILVVAFVIVLLLMLVKAYRSKSKSGHVLENEFRKVEQQNREIKKQAETLVQSFSDTSENDTLSPEEEYINRIREYVLENISDSGLDIESIARTFGESYSNMYRKIKSYTGLTPGELIKNIRLKHARQLLHRKEKNIAEVAYEAGFSTPSYFTRCFKDFYKESPTDYLKKIRE